MLASREKAKKKLIPVFLVSEVEVSKNIAEELIVYAQKLSVLDEEYPQTDDDKATDKCICGALLKIEGMDEEFITTDFMKNEV